jgi:tetratricopeptide (TPR) repeat protein
MLPLAGYQAEMQHIGQDIAAVERNALAEPIDPQRVTQYIYRLYQRGSIAGDPAQLTAVELVIDRALPLLTNPGDLYLLKANIAFKLHRLADGEAALAAVPSVYDSHEGRLIRADLDFQHGRYADAKTGYLEALKAERSWGALARLAYFHGKMGDAGAADGLYDEAQDQLTAKEMRSYAWLEIQRGFLDFAHGRHEEAQIHYARADAAYPGYWLVAEYTAELLGAKGKYRSAIAIIEGIIAATDRPELRQAIGELYELAGEAGRARNWHQRALTGYLQSVQHGEVHYWHHLADYYSDVAKNGAQAVRWARADLQLRENFSTQAALAWAYYRRGQSEEACDWIGRALASGAVEAHLLSRAAKIYASVGQVEPARNHLERATRLNPLIEKFHMHH